MDTWNCLNNEFIPANHRCYIDYNVMAIVSSNSHNKVHINFFEKRKESVVKKRIAFVETESSPPLKHCKEELVQLPLQKVKLKLFYIHHFL